MSRSAHASEPASNAVGLPVRASELEGSTSIGTRGVLLQARYANSVGLRSWRGHIKLGTQRGGTPWFVEGRQQSRGKIGRSDAVPSALIALEEAHHGGR